MLKKQSKNSLKAHFESLEDRRFLSVNITEEVVSEPPAVIGDANNDGQFSSDDLVVVFQAGEYEDGIPQNSTLEEGDFNGDGDFDSGDLVTAFQYGNYQNGPMSAEAGETNSRRVVQRDLQELLDAQGTFYAPHPLAPETPPAFFFNNAPDINGDGVDDGQRYIMYFDWAGTLGRESSYEGQFGPESIAGKVTERPLGNGMSEVTASVRTRGAQIWVTTWDAENRTVDWLFRDGPTVFGHRETELLADPELEAAEANVHFSVKFLIEEGAPLPDLFTANWMSFQLVLNAEGPLTEAFGVPDGTTGRITWGKPGLWQDGNSPANENADNGAASLFPNDEFHIGVIGPRPK